jgi:hypothetical protein
MKKYTTMSYYRYDFGDKTVSISPRGDKVFVNIDWSEGNHIQGVESKDKALERLKGVDIEDLPRWIK